MGVNDLMRGRIQGTAVSGVVVSVAFVSLYSFMRRKFEKRHKEDQEIMLDLLDELCEYRSRLMKSPVVSEKEKETVRDTAAMEGTVEKERVV